MKKRIRRILRHTLLSSQHISKGEAVAEQILSRRNVENIDYLPDWERMIRDERSFWDERLQQCVGAPKILLPTTVGGMAALSSMESMLAVALTLRGFEVHVLLCDAALPACLRVEHTTIKDAKDVVSSAFQAIICKTCQSTGDYLFTPLGIKIHRLSELVSNTQRDYARKKSHEVAANEISSFKASGISVGEHAYAGTLRYFASGNLDDQEMGEAVLRRYLEASILTMNAINELTSRYHYHSSCFNHGIYCPHGIISEVLRSRGVKVSTWNIAYRRKCFIFSHDDTYHHTLLNEPNSNWENIEFNDKAKKRILTYLKSRLKGSKDWIWFHEKPQESFSIINETLGLDLSKPIIGMLTNVMWDAQLHYEANAFPDMLSWVFETIEYFIGRADLQLVIRIHPAEVRGTLPSKQPLLKEIHKRWPTLPDNVKVIEPESQISTYAIMAQCDSVIIYGTKTGVELTSVGIPVIVAGEAWIRNKQVTRDANSVEDYLKILETLPLGRRLDEKTQTRALKYAFHFFYRRMIPLQFMGKTGAWPPYKPVIRSLKGLLPGVDVGLDIICDGITQGREFIYPAEDYISRRQRILSLWPNRLVSSEHFDQRPKLTRQMSFWMQNQGIERLILLSVESRKRAEKLAIMIGFSNHINIEVVNPSFEESLHTGMKDSTAILVVGSHDQEEMINVSLNNESIRFVAFQASLEINSSERNTFNAFHQMLIRHGFRLAGVLEQTFFGTEGQPLMVETIYRRN